jgi:DNA-binding SARP family transcriptional activator
VEFRILGQLEILDGERRLQLGGTKRRAVAALLLLDANQVVSTERLVDGVWGDDPPAAATGSLHNHVLRLRRELGDRLITRAPGYLLRAEPGEPDLDRFRRLADDARSAEPERAAALLREALALWRGAPLADLVGEPVAEAAVHLEELRLDALERRIDADLALGRRRDLVAELEALVGEQPFREHLRAQLLLALYRSGRQGDALEAYAAARAALVEELGAEPGAELQELHRAILRHDPALAGPAALESDGRSEEVEEARKTVTVLVADLPVERTGDPEARRDELTRHRDGAAAVVDGAGGTIGHTADERLLGIFGVPVAHDDDALRAVHAACALRDRGLVSRVAVATGDVITGDPGRGRPLVSGRPLDEADRLRSEAMGGDVLVDERAWRLVRHAVDAAPARHGHLVTAVRDDVEGVVRSFDSPFVGRDAELAEIEAALTRVERDGRARLLTVFGSPGIGKTRLAGEAVAAAGDRATCLVARTLPHGIGLTYAPLRDALADLTAGSIGAWVAGLLAGEADAELVAARVAAAVGEGPSAGPAEETAWAARRTLERLARERPVLLVLEDLHWAAPAFLDLVEHVAELGRGPVLVLALVRPDLLDVRPNWGGGGLAASSILLDALAPDQAADLVDGLAGETALDLTRRDAILRAGEGNPPLPRASPRSRARGRRDDRARHDPRAARRPPRPARRRRPARRAGRRPVRPELPGRSRGGAPRGRRAPGPHPSVAA